jgi:thiosulfate/3-mercaptopyruvate sulfurtransferase
MEDVMRKPLIPAVLLAAALGAGCSDRTITEPEPTLRTRTELLVSTDWLSSRLQDPSVVVLHVGTQANYDAGHLPGARFVNLGPLQPTQHDIPLMLASVAVLREAFEAAGVSASSHVILTGDGLAQATRGFFMLEYLGHTKVSLLDGGKAVWQAEGRPLSTERVTVTRSNLATSPAADRLATLDWVMQNGQRPGVALVDARAPVDYAGDVAPTANLPRPGHIPGAWNIPWTELVVSTSAPRMKDVESLLSLHASLGTDPRTTVVPYCFSGMLSSVSYFAARYLGYDVKLYDGSMFEWSRRADLPVAKCATRTCN